MPMTKTGLTVTELFQDASTSVFTYLKEDISSVTVGSKTNLGLGDTGKVLVKKAGAASHLADFSGTGSGSITGVSVTLDSRLGDAIVLTDEELANLGPADKQIIEEQVGASVVGAIAKAHSIVTIANFPNVIASPPTAKAATAVTLADLNTWINGVVTAGKMNLNKMKFICRPFMFNNLVDGLTTLYATSGSNSLTGAVINGSSFTYKGVQVIRSTNLPANVTGGYFCDGSHVGLLLGVDKSVTDKCDIGRFEDPESGLSFVVRSFYDNNAGAWKYFPYVVCGAAKANVDGALLPNWT